MVTAPLFGDLLRRRRKGERAGAGSQAYGAEGARAEEIAAGERTFRVHGNSLDRGFGCCRAERSEEGVP
jgi:hypothetical protein